MFIDHASYSCRNGYGVVCFLALGSKGMYKRAILGVLLWPYFLWPLLGNLLWHKLNFMNWSVCNVYKVIGGWLSLDVPIIHSISGCGLAMHGIVLHVHLGSWESFKNRYVLWFVLALACVNGGNKSSMFVGL